jgi:hypothetical protein
MTRKRIDSRLGCLALLILGIAMAMPGTAAATDNKTYTFDVAPDSSAAGPAQAFEITIKNTASGPQSLGSANVSAPAPFDVKSAVSNRGVATLAGEVVQLRNLNLAPGASVVTRIIVDDSSTTGTWVWSSKAKQANDFAGSGNDFIVDPARASDFDVEVTGNGGRSVACPEEPTGTTVACRGKITYRGILNGVPYTTSIEAVADPALPANAGTLVLELPTATNIDCPTLTERSPVTGRVTGPLNRAKTVTFTLNGVPGLGTEAPPGICYASPNPFVTTGPGVPILFGGMPHFVGTLPDCDPTGFGISLSVVTPCIRSRVNSAGTWVISVEVPATVPDPGYRG